MKYRSIKKPATAGRIAVSDAMKAALAMKAKLKVYVVKQWNVCECEPQCACDGYSIDDIFLSEEKAKERASQRYHAFVDEYDVK